MKDRSFNLIDRASKRESSALRMGRIILSCESTAWRTCALPDGFIKPKIAQVDFRKLAREEIFASEPREDQLLIVQGSISEV